MTSIDRDKQTRRAEGRVPLRRPPPCKPGQSLRTLERRRGEDYEDASARAQAFAWWLQRTHDQPYCSARAWIWVVRL